jgi:predicted RNA methylase
MTIVTAGELPDFKRAPNQGGNIELYEVENRALDPDGHLLAAMRARAPWAGRTLLDLGCGSGYWLGGYADEAAEVIGVEPDPRLLPLAAGRDPRVRVLRGSAEHKLRLRAVRHRQAGRAAARPLIAPLTGAGTSARSFLIML